MATIRPFKLFDLLEYNNINLDILTETFNTLFYGKYIAKWPEYCITQVNCTGRFQSYLLGKIEGDKSENSNKKNWHGHMLPQLLQLLIQGDKELQDFQWIIQNKSLKSIMAGLQICLQGLQTILQLECTKLQTQIKMKILGYDVYQVVNKYYSSQNGKSEDAYDMRKSMKRDVEKVTMKSLGKKIQPDQLEFN